MGEWRIYYEGGRTRDSADGLPTGEDARGVQVILQNHEEVGWYTQSGSDYYIWNGERWIGVDRFGLYDFLLDSGLVVFGRMTTGKRFRELLNSALEDRTLARKTGYLRGERGPDGST